MRRNQILTVAAIGSAISMAGLVAWAQDKGDYEKTVKEAEIPKAALETLKKLAQGAAFTEFAEEVEHGHKYFEGSWKGGDGNVDGLVTEAGDVMELEESIPADKAPAAVRAAAEKEAGKEAKVSFERKTVYLYEIHYKKDGKGREMIFTADGRQFHEDDGDRSEPKDDDDDDKDGR